MRSLVRTALVAVLTFGLAGPASAAGHEPHGGIGDPAEPDRPAGSFAPPPVAKVDTSDLDFGAQELERVAAANRAEDR